MLHVHVCQIATGVVLRSLVVARDVIIVRVLVLRSEVEGEVALQRRPIATERRRPPVRALRTRVTVIVI